jgi:3-oxoacyl-[acyl-carrier-protein] synthase-3
MRAAVLGLGSFLPDTVRENTDWPADFVGRLAGRAGSELADVRAADGDPCGALMTRYLAAEADDPFRGSTRRRVADPAMSSAEAEAIAGRRALADAGVAASEVDLVLSWAMVPDRVTPPTGPRVAHLLGAERAAGLGMDAACATAIAQLALGAAMIESGRARLVLLTQSHLIARANPLDHPASPLVGDAASAIVLGASEKAGVGFAHMVSQGEYHDAVTWVRGRGEDEPPWFEAGACFVAGSRDRAAVKALSSRLVHVARDTVAELLERARRPIGSIDVLACTQPRRWFPAAVAESVGLPPAKAPHTFDELGHIGGVAPVINLIEARRLGLLGPGASVLLFGMGAGITRAAALLTF